MRVLVCGSRDFDNAEFLELELALLRNQSLMHDRPDWGTIIEGEAPGADTLARLWAEKRGLLVGKFPADWKKYGRAAGPIRNKQMLDEGKPDLVVAFPKGYLSESRGTKNMVEQARKAGIPVVVYEPDPSPMSCSNAGHKTRFRTGANEGCDTCGVTW